VSGLFHLTSHAWVFNLHFRLAYIRFYHLRTYDRINAPLGYVKQIEERSGVSFVEAQVALSRLWIDNDIADQSEVQLNLLDEERNAGGLSDAKVEGDVVKVKVPQTQQEARDIIEKFERAAREIRSDENVSDNVVQHVLRDRTGLLDERWEGNEEEEREA
jgi:phospholipase D1/2